MRVYTQSVEAEKTTGGEEKSRHPFRSESSSRFFSSATEPGDRPSFAPPPPPPRLFERKKKKEERNKKGEKKQEKRKISAETGGRTKERNESFDTRTVEEFQERNLVEKRLLHPRCI